MVLIDVPALSTTTGKLPPPTSAPPAFSQVPVHHCPAVTAEPAATKPASIAIWMTSPETNPSRSRERRISGTATLTPPRRVNTLVWRYGEPAGGSVRPPPPAPFTRYGLSALL